VWGRCTGVLPSERIDDSKEISEWKSNFASTLVTNEMEQEILNVYCCSGTTREIFEI
jgi:hypothetical protein